MLALYRSSRQAEALEAYRGARRELSSELGLEPSAELKQLEQAILQQDPALDLAPPRRGAARARRRPRCPSGRCSSCRPRSTASSGCCDRGAAGGVAAAARAGGRRRRRREPS